MQGPLVVIKDSVYVPDAACLPHAWSMFYSRQRRTVSTEVGKIKGDSVGSKIESSTEIVNIGGNTAKGELENITQQTRKTGGDFVPLLSLSL
jgi:hypothetical protein